MTTKSSACIGKSMHVFTIGIRITVVTAKDQMNSLQKVPLLNFFSNKKTCIIIIRLNLARLKCFAS